MATIRIIDGPEADRTYSLPDGHFTLGRGEQCDVQIFENSISRQHATITKGKDGWKLQDLESQNGVFLQDERVETIDLKGTLVFRLGNVTIEFTEDGRAPTEDAQATDNDDDAADATGTKPAPPPNQTVSDDELIERVRRMAELYPVIEKEFGQVIVGQRDVLEELLVAIAANGHCLMVGLPGLAKTLMIHTLSRILQLTFKRIQFTPDLMPSDILGTEVLETDETSGEKSFRFIKGPVFTNMLLADEINRTPPKTQAALLESMQERQVTIANHKLPLPEPFFVLATQNPLEQEGTYPLPEAQLDRFMFNIIVGYPSAEEEEAIVEQTTRSRSADLHAILSAEDLLALQRTVRDLPASKHVIKYATSLVRATRPDDVLAPPFIKEHVYCGAGPRAAQNLILGAKSKAVIHGRLNVSCDDVRALALPVMRHRIFTNFTADSEGITTDDLVRRLIEHIPEPSANDYE